MTGCRWSGCQDTTGTGSVGGDERAMLVYFVNRLYEYENPDEVRRPWDWYCDVNR